MTTANNQQRSFFNSGVDFTNPNDGKKFLMDLNLALDNFVAGLSYLNNQLLSVPISFKSAVQAITSGGTLTLPHGIQRQGVAAIPQFVQAYLQNVTPEANYIVGDIVPVNIFPIYRYTLGIDFVGQTFSLTEIPYGCYVLPDATNLNVKFTNSASAFTIFDKSAMTAFYITNANWTIFFTAAG